MSRSVRRGVTLFQVLLVLALLGILFALLLPAVLRVRAAAARLTSANNLKQIGIAVHNYASSYQDKLPPGCDPNNFSAFAQLLPFVEQEHVFRMIDFMKPCDDKANKAAAAVVIKVFLDPRDAQMGVVPGLGATNYLFCAGSEPALDGNNGMFARPGKYKIANVPDGLSNTIMAGEILKGNGKTDMTTVERQHVLLGKDALKNLKDDTGAADWKAGKNIAADRGASWIDGRFLQGTFTGTRRINDERPDVNCGGFGGLSALRGTERGVQVVLGDGSVRFVNQTVSMETWKNACSCDDGNVLGNDF
jgi:hypothetical protein